MKTRLQKITGIVGVLAGALIIFTPFQLAPVCQRFLELKTGNMVHMRCHYTGQAEVFLGMIILITSVLLLLARETGTRKSLGKLLVVLGVAAIILPTKLGIGVCLNPMECHTTAGVLYLLGGLLLADGLAVHLEKDMAGMASEKRQETAL